MRYRVERDEYGEVKVPLQAYFGVGSQRSKDLFQITKHGINRQMIRSLAWIKKSAAKANCDCGNLDEKRENAISLACDEIINGRLHGQFVTDLVQGGSGIAMNINANEVIANRANELLGGEKGQYDIVHPVHHVNLNQDDITVVLMASKFSTNRLVKKLLTEAKKLLNAIEDKVREYNLDNSEYSFGQEILMLADTLEKDIKRVNNRVSSLLEVNLTIPNLISENDVFVKKYIKYLSQFVGENIKHTTNPLSFNRSLDDIGQISYTLKALMSNVAKGANDLLMFAKQGKVKLEYEAYQTIEVVNQISFYVMGNDLTIQRAIEAGELDKNIYIPIIFACLFEMVNLIRRTIRTYRERVIELMRL